MWNESHYTGKQRVGTAMGRVTAEVEAIVAQSEQLRSVDRIEFLDKGFSDEREYVLWESGERTYLLRISGLEKSLRRRQDFELLRVHHNRGIRCSPPLEFGVDESGRLCYALLGYILARVGLTRFRSCRTRPSSKSGWMQAESYALYTN